MNDRICKEHGPYYQDKRLFSNPVWDNCPVCENQQIAADDRAHTLKAIEGIGKDIENFIASNAEYRSELEARVVKCFSVPTRIELMESVLRANRAEQARLEKEIAEISNQMAQITA
jgi:hypothetical protein